MIVLGVILLIIGLVLVLAPVPIPNADPVGWFLALIGVILVVVALLVGADLHIGAGGILARYWG